jgi:hypothetical protein
MRLLIYLLMAVNTLGKRSFVSARISVSNLPLYW